MLQIMYWMGKSFISIILHSEFSKRETELRIETSEDACKKTHKKRNILSAPFLYVCKLHSCFLLNVILQDLSRSNLFHCHVTYAADWIL